MGDLKIGEAIEKVRSERVTKRTEGIADLKHVLDQSRRFDQLEGLSDKGYHKIFEALFHAVSTERSAYSTASKSSLKTLAATRLSTCAAVLRLAVQAGVKKLKQRTVKALVDHITQTLSCLKPDLCGPLLLDYAKSLHILLKYQPHTEHLPSDEWHSLLDFCSETITSQDDEEGSSQGGSFFSASQLTLGSASISTNGAKTAVSRSVMEEIVFCVQQLLYVQRVPRMDVTRRAFSALLVFFRTAPNVARAHQAALSAYNTLILRASTEHMYIIEPAIKQIFPLLRRLWTTKSVTLRDEVLISTIYSRTYLEYMLQQDEYVTLPSEPEIFLDMLEGEFSKRSDRDQLQLEDVGLEVARESRKHHAPLQTRIMFLQGNAPRSEQNWVTLQLVAFLILCLDKRASHQINDDGSVHKRRRKNLRFPDLLRRLMVKEVSGRLFVLQVICFVAERTEFEAEELKSLLERLLPCISDENTVVASWAMVAVASCAVQISAKATASSSLWLQLWLLGSRSATSGSTCRAACYLCSLILEISLVPYTSIATSIEDITSSIDLNGPAALTDTAITFCTTLSDLRQSESPASSARTSERLIHWLFSRWSPVKIGDRHAVAQYAVHARPVPMLKLLFACLGTTPLTSLCEVSATYGLLGQAWLAHLDRETLIRYLLLLDKVGDNDNSYEAKSDRTEAILTQSDHGRGYRQHEPAVLDYCTSQFNRAVQIWTEQLAERVLNVTADAVRTMTSFCVIGCVLRTRSSSRDSRRAHELSQSVLALVKALSMYLARQDCDQSCADATLEIIAPFLPDLTSPKLFSNQAAECVIKTLVEGVAPALESRRRLLEESSHPIDIGDMDFDDAFESQGSRLKLEAGIHTEFPRNMDAARASPASFRHSLMASLHLTASINMKQGFSASVLLNYLFSLHHHEFLASWDFLREVTESREFFDGPDTDRLLVHLGEQYLQSYEYERCESFMSICLDVMTGSAVLWAQEPTEELEESSSELYAWFINVALGKDFASPQTQMGIANLLQRLLRVAPEYGQKDPALSSVRTSLLKILQDGSIRVKFYLAERIPDIFGLFTLDQHDAIFEDVLSSLPRDADWKEGIALRLLALARLASAWYTLLRRSVYHIFETPGLIEDAVPHAIRCLADASSALHLSSARELFDLFLPQIIHTWLETQPLHSMPFSIFGFGTLLDMLRVVKCEAVGQLVMRGEDSQIEELATLLAVSFEGLIIDSFDRVMAYSVARDISLPPAEDSPSYINGEQRIRTRLGKETFRSQVSIKFPQIVARLLRCIEGEEQIERAFAKRLTFKYAADILKAVQATSTSDAVLPVSQQPNFRARYLLDELEHLCHRARQDLMKIWTPSLLTYVLRQLLDMVHPALGSLHACSVIRKIRIVVALAGDAALRYYPLEMLLVALRPFLSDAQCADDTIGLVQYLFSGGERYLSTIPSFIAGISLSILASLRTFFDSSQHSTSLESHYRATIGKAQAFHRWFGKYIQKYDSSVLSDSAERSFRAILRSAHSIRGSGGAIKGTHESDMLRELLGDEGEGRRLLNRASLDLAFSLICDNFQGPSDFRDDIFGSDDVSIANAVAVWRSCQRRNIGGGYLVWAGQVLGRAYAASGHVPREMLAESEVEHVQVLPDMSFADTSGSKPAILSIICDLLQGDAPQQVGLAESTLQAIVLRCTELGDVTECENILPSSLLAALRWHIAPPEVSRSAVPPRLSVRDAARRHGTSSVEHFIQRLCIALAYAIDDDAIIGTLPPMLSHIGGLAEQVFPYVLHTVLSRDIDRQQSLRTELSEAFGEWFRDREQSSTAHVKVLLVSLLYLRNQPLPRERNRADREHWLDIDHREAAEAAAHAGMYKTALLLFEVASSTMRTARRLSVVQSNESHDLLQTIFRNIDDPDSFYGVQQRSSLASIMNRAEYERDGIKSLSFRGAHHDSQVRRASGIDDVDSSGLIEAMGHLELNGLSLSLLQGQASLQNAIESTKHMYQAARKLEQWDLPAPVSHRGEEATIYRTLQSINTMADPSGWNAKLDSGLSDIMTQMMSRSQTSVSMQSLLRCLAVLTEAGELFASGSAEQLRESWERLRHRQTWMLTGRFEDVSQILSVRETVLSSLSRRPKLQNLIRASPRETRIVEVEALLESSQMSRRHGALQYSLTAATYLTALIEPCHSLGLDITAAAQNESASVLWDQGEMAASIGVLHDMNSGLDLQKQSIRVGKSELLAKLGHQISEARLEKPDEIISRYLLPAIEELHGVSDGKEAGQVFHEFAAFCDQQLQDPDNLEDFRRIERLRRRKELEVQDLEKMYQAAPSQSRGDLQAHRNRARQWFELDDLEYQRLHASRQAFLRQSLENYLLSLKACETHNNDAMRFCALWLEQSGSDLANQAVSTYLGEVPSRKFASLINQLSSRLLDNQDKFQSLLFPLITKICKDHPFHGMYQIFSISKSKGKDESSISRHAAAVRMVAILKKDGRSMERWRSVHNTSVCYTRLAGEKLDPKCKAGSRMALRKLQTGERLEQHIVGCRIPPPTMTIELRSDCDYSSIPTIAKFHPDFSVAGGVSAPKIVTAIGTDGVQYRQLVKGGNDDLRQDAIMEQVFEQVSQLLQHNRSTRQRDLRIRTYRVLPLTTNAGIIEFVPHTIPLHDYLLPAHQRHYPQDWRPMVCRKTIDNVQGKSVEIRLKAYRAVAEHFHPVMRYFFMERFPHPDEWFEKRLAYSRSTAAISILGHVLGLGDRHGHNILLDEETGEVVHIDLGVSFEQGRVLPVPEVVPFRLTRDIVDGMGITGTEGVFRRCCEFTLAALRKESYGIMTILDVLRYDPLYSWTVSPLRMKRQLPIVPNEEANNTATNAPDLSEARIGTRAMASRESERKSLGLGLGLGLDLSSNGDEPSEADRALTVVAKKLSKTLSVTATVNELIQQATDERYLAVLYCGWAAYA